MKYLSISMEPCPFCGSDNLGYSIKATGRFKTLYHACIYCKSCHTYGARVLKEYPRNINRTTVENDSELKSTAIEHWNKRVYKV